MSESQVEVAPAATDLFAAARAHMVASQLRPNRVTDPRVLAAMGHLPRERFLPPALAALAYSDEDVSLGDGRVLMEPMVLARLVQLARPLPGERVLVVGAGVGYGAAVIAACGAVVTALEEEARLIALARAALAEAAPGVAIAEGPLAAGFPAGAPWDVVFIEGAVAEVPAVLAEQTRRGGGRVVAVRAGVEGVGVAVLAEMTAAGMVARAAFDCATPTLPAFRPAAGFVF